MATIFFLGNIFTFIVKFNKEKGIRVKLSSVFLDNPLNYIHNSNKVVH
jgi:hypothetical protein